MSIVYADERPQASSSSQEIDHWPLLPAEVIVDNILPLLYADEAEAPSCSFMAVSRECYRLADVFYAPLTKANMPWQSCPDINQRTLYYTYRYMSMLTGMHMNICLERAIDGHKTGLIYAQFSKLCSRFLNSTLWAQDTILWLYPKWLSIQVVGSSSKEEKKHFNQLSCLINPYLDSFLPYFEMLDNGSHDQDTNNLFKLMTTLFAQREQSAVPTEWLPTIHMIFCALTPESLRAHKPEVVAVESVFGKDLLFAPLNPNLLSLKLALPNMRASQAVVSDQERLEYCNVIETIVLLEPLPTVRQLDMACRAWLKNKNNARAIRHFDTLMAEATNTVYEIYETIDFHNMGNDYENEKVTMEYLSALYSFVEEDSKEEYLAIAHYLVGEISKGGHEPSAIDYMRIIHAYAAAGYFAYAGDYCLQLMGNHTSLLQHMKLAECEWIARLMLRLADVCFNNRREFGIAAQRYAQVIALRKAKGQVITERTYNRAHQAFEYIGQYEEAIKYFRQKMGAFKSKEISEDYNYLAELCSKVGYSYLKSKQYDKAKEFHAQEVEAQRASGKLPIEECYTRLMDVYADAGLYKEGVEYYKLREEALKSKGAPAGSYHSLTYKISQAAILSFNANDFSNAGDLYLLEMEVLQIAGQRVTSRQYDMVAYSYLRSGQYETAIKYYLLKMAACEAEQEQVYATDYETLAKLYSKNGQYEEAINYYLMYMGGTSKYWGKVQTKESEYLADLCAKAGDSCLNAANPSKAHYFYMLEIEAQKASAQLSTEKIYDRIISSYVNAGLVEEAVAFQIKKIDALIAAKSEIQKKEHVLLDELLAKAGQPPQAFKYQIKNIEAHSATRREVQQKEFDHLDELCARAGQYEEAVELYRHILDRSQADWRVYEMDQTHLAELCSNASDICLKAGQPRKANEYRVMAITARLAARQQIDASEYLKVAQWFFEVQDYLQSANYFMKGMTRLRTTGIKIEPSVYAQVCEVLLKAGDEYLAAGQYDLAGDNYAKEIEERKAFGKAVEAKDYKRVGDVYFKAKRKEATEFYQLHIKLKKDAGMTMESDDYKFIGLAYVQAGRSLDAIAAYKEEANLRRGKLPLDAEYHKRMGDAHMGAKNFDLAKNSYDQRIKVLEKAGQPIAEACLDAQKACELSTSAVVKQQADKYRQMAAPTSAPISAKARS